MDYEGALERLRQQMEETPRSGDFLPLEARLRENLARESRYGSSENLRSERTEICDRLNVLALGTLGITLNDLLFGRAAGPGLASHRLEAVRGQLAAAPTPQAVAPPVTPNLQILPFQELSWEQFELLCAALVAVQADVIDCHLYGLRGEDQKGIDIVATRQKENGRETWVYQCKRHETYSAKLLQEALDKLEYPADVYVVLLSSEASAKLRDVVADRGDTFLWDARDISRKLKGFPQLVEDFFGAAWRKAFAP